jgi:hypothetical protein
VDKEVGFPIKISGSVTVKKLECLKQARIICI